MLPRPLLILGPTASGKSELAVGLAERLGGEVISSDSMQIYRHMDAGTAKPTPAQRARARHHLVDIVEPTEPFTAAEWLKRAEALMVSLQAQGKTPIVVGGTNLYVKGLLEGMFEGPGQDPAFRASLEGIPTPELHVRLKSCDAAAADKIGMNDRQRVVRALEVFQVTGTPISTLQAQWQATPKPYRFDPILIGLEWPTDQINLRINLRVKAMFFPDTVDAQLAADVCIGGESLPKEVMRLNGLGLFAPMRVDTGAGGLGGASDPAAESRVQECPRPLVVEMPNQAREAIGYKQVLAALNGGDPLIHSMQDAFDRTQILTRNYAKQQRTWLRKFRDVRWIAASGLDGAQVADKAMGLI